MRTMNLMTISIVALAVLLLAGVSLLVHPLLVMGGFLVIALVCSGVWLARHRAPSFRRAVAYADLGLAAICLLLWLTNLLGWTGIGSTESEAIAGVVCLSLGLMLLGEKKHEKQSG